MEEDNKLYIAISLTSAIFVSPFKTNKFESHKYFMNRDLKKEYIGPFRNGYYLNLNNYLNLKEFKIEILK